MSDFKLDREIKILSGEAERELQEEKLKIAADLARRKRERVELKELVKSMDAAQCGDLLPTVAALSPHEKKQYSIANVVRNLISGSKELTLEKEISASIAADLKVAPAHGGVLVPFRLEASGLDTKTDRSGGYLTAPGVSKNIIDALRANCAVLGLGATFIGGLRFDLELPVEDAICAASWVSENPGSDVSESDASFKLRILRPHPMQATTTVSRQLLRQSSPDLEQWLRNRLAKAHGTLLDLAAIHGSGLSNEPIGILTNSAISTVSIGTNGGAVAASHLVALEKAVSDANADTGALLAFLTNGAQRAKLRAVPSLATGTTPLWHDRSLLDYPAAVSNQVSRTLVKGASGAVCSAVIFANWNSLILGEFGGALELIFDPYASKKQGLAEITSFAAYDVGLAQPASFAAIVDAI